MNNFRELLSLADMMDTVRDFVITQKDSSLPYVGLEHLEPGFSQIATIGSADDSISMNICFKAGDILFGKLRPNLRKSAAVAFPGYCSTEFIVLRPKPGINPSYAAWIMRSDQIFAEAIRTAEGTRMPRTSWSRLSNLKVRVPSLVEQQRIADVLDAIDERIQASERVIAKMSIMLRGIVDELMSHGINDTSTAMRSGRLGDFLTLKRGFDITVAEQSDGKVPVISSSGFTSYHNKAMVAGPGVVIGRKGKLGRAYYVECDFWPHDTSLWVTDFKGNNPKFISYFLEWLHLERLDAATSVPTLNRNFVHPLYVTLPEPADQVRIVNEIESWEHRIRCERDISFKLQEARQGLMEVLLTGRVRVTDDGGTERVGTS